MAKNTSISFGPHFEAFIMQKIQSGRYQSVSEVVRSGLRLLEEQDQKKEILLKALDEGEASGLVENFDAKAHLKNLKARKK
jgi:antitoxin ParD1/3/4